jgi:hypothetical protein
MIFFGYSQNRPIVYAINLFEFRWLRWLKCVLFDLIEKSQVELTSYTYIHIYKELSWLWFVGLPWVYQIVFQIGVLRILKEIYWIQSSNSCLVLHLVFFNHYSMSCVNFLAYGTRKNWTLHLCDHTPRL